MFQKARPFHENLVHYFQFLKKSPAFWYGLDFNWHLFALAQLGLELVDGTQRTKGEFAQFCDRLFLKWDEKLHFYSMLHKKDILHLL